MAKIVDKFIDLSFKAQNTKFGIWLTDKVNSFPEQPIDYQETFVNFIVQVKLLTHNKQRKEKKGDIVKRRLHINYEGLSVFTLEDEFLEEFKYVNIQKFFYAPDKNFVVIVHVLREANNISQNIVFHTSKQAPEVEKVINGFIRKRLEAQGKTPEKSNCLEENQNFFEDEQKKEEEEEELTLLK